MSEKKLVYSPDFVRRVEEAFWGNIPGLDSALQNNDPKLADILRANTAILLSAKVIVRLINEDKQDTVKKAAELSVERQELLEELEKILSEFEKE
jgi:hypothetical protein